MSDKFVVYPVEGKFAKNAVQVSTALIIGGDTKGAALFAPIGGDYVLSNDSVGDRNTIAILGQVGTKKVNVRLSNIEVSPNMPLTGKVRQKDTLGTVDIDTTEKLTVPLPVASEIPKTTQGLIFEMSIDGVPINPSVGMDRLGAHFPENVKVDDGGKITAVDNPATPEDESKAGPKGGDGFGFGTLIVIGGLVFAAKKWLK